MPSTKSKTSSSSQDNGGRQQTTHWTHRNWTGGTQCRTTSISENARDAQGESDQISKTTRGALAARISLQCPFADKASGVLRSSLFDNMFAIVSKVHGFSRNQNLALAAEFLSQPKPSTKYPPSTTPLVVSRSNPSSTTP